MSTLRLPYADLSPAVYQGFIQAKTALEQSTLGTPLIDLLYLRISQINGCAFCLEMHAAALKAGGEADRRLNGLAGWRVSHRYTERERAALAWAESLTDIADGHAPDEIYTPLKDHFNDAEIADLTFAAALMNAFNRLAIGMRQ